MPNQFERFTERARTVLMLAQEEARRFNHNYIGTEHLLLGLVREADGVAARVLGDFGVRLPKVRAQVEFIIGRGETRVAGEIGLTPRAKRVIEFAIDEARRLNHHFVGTEHLLLGIGREGEGIAANVLENLGLNLDTVRTRMLQVVSGDATRESRPEAEPLVPARASVRQVAAARDARHLVGRVRRHVRHNPEDVDLAVLALLALIWLELRRIGRRRG